MNEKPTKLFRDVLKERSLWLAKAFATFFLKIGLTANMITIIGCLAHVVAFWMIYRGYFLATGIFLMVFACADTVDGTMARMETGGKGTKFGAVLDSVTDRISEILLLGAILLYYSSKEHGFIYICICIVAIMGSILVPYTRAKGELYGFDMRLGIMTRVERYVVLLISLIIGYPIIGAAVVAVFSNITAVQRMLYIKRNLENNNGDS